MRCRLHHSKTCVLLDCRLDRIEDGLTAALASTAAILTLLQQFERKLDTMANEMDSLIASVARNKELIGSTITLLNGLNDRIKAAGTDAAKLAAITADLDDQDKTLAAAEAVIENTPAAEPPTT